jgi:2-C-methyl-D-erythritol 2,4-cyclodiphosphate synthase
LEEQGYLIENIDATIIAQRPKMRDYIDTMRENIADSLGIEISQVNVKATTEEGMGFTGEGRGISSQAVCSLVSIYDKSGLVSVGDAPQENSIAGCSGGCGRCPAAKTCQDKQEG